MFPLFAWVPGPMEFAIIGVLGVLFFGRRLPEVGRSLGKGIVEFKKGIKGMEDDIDTASDGPSTYDAPPPRPPEKVSAGAPKFDAGTDDAPKA